MAIALVAMATSMVSCNNDDADFIEQQAPAATAAKADVRKSSDLNFLVAIAPGQMDYYDEEYTISVNGELQTVKVADMMAMTAEQALAYSDAKNLAESFDCDAEFYLLPLGQITMGTTAKVVDYKATVKADHPADEFDFIKASCVLSAGGVPDGIKDVQLFKGVYADEENMIGIYNLIAANGTKTYLKY